MRTLEKQEEEGRLKRKAFQTFKPFHNPPRSEEDGIVMPKMRGIRQAAEAVRQDAAEDRTDASLEVPGGVLRRCEKCGMPTECRRMVLGRTLTFSCMCRCRQEEEARRKKADEERERMIALRRLRSTGIQDRHFRGWRFSAAEDTEVIQRARQYVANWKRARSENIGLLFWGGVGTGKTFAAACIANALIERAVPVLMTNFPKIMGQMGGLYTEERSQYLGSFRNYPLLVIDDFGVERDTEYAKEQVYAVIDERYRSGLPLIITTNLPIAALRRPENAADARIYSRVLDMCAPVHVGGGDRRMASGRGKMEALMGLLSSACGKDPCGNADAWQSPWPGSMSFGNREDVPSGSGSLHRLQTDSPGFWERGMG